MKVGVRDVLLWGTIHVPDGESALVSCEIAKDDVLNVEFKFILEDIIEVDNVKKRPPAKLTIRGSGDGSLFEVICTNFDKPLGHTLQRPFELGWSNELEPLTLIATIARFGAVTKIDYQIMIERAQA